MAYDWMTEWPAVFSRHADSCPKRDGRECTCGPLGYCASIRDWKTDQRITSPLFQTIDEARAWQRDQAASQDATRRLATERGELAVLIDEFLQAADDGVARDAGNQPYTREGIRALRGALSYVDSELGKMDVQDVRRQHIQALIGQLRGAGVPQARIAAVIEALRALYAYAIQRELVGFSPVVELDALESQNGVPQNGVPYSVPAQAKAPSEVKASAGPTAEDATTGDGGTTPPPVGDPWTPPPFPSPGRSDFLTQYGENPEVGHDTPLPGDATPPDDPMTPPGYATPPPGYPTPAPGYPAPPPGYPTPPPGYATPPPGYPTPPPGYLTPPPGYATPPPGYPTPPPGYATPPPGYATPPPDYATPPPGYATFPQPNAPQPNAPDQGSGPLSAIMGSPGTVADANYDSTMQERWLWWTVRIIVIVFVLIALVLVAESV